MSDLSDIDLFDSSALADSLRVTRLVVRGSSTEGARTMSEAHRAESNGGDAGNRTRVQHVEQVSILLCPFQIAQCIKIGLKVQREVQR